MKNNSLARLVKSDVFSGKFKLENTSAFEIYDTLNTHVFGSMEIPPIRIKNIKDQWAWTDGRMKDGELKVHEIVLNKNFPHKAWAIATIAHEMIHQWQWEVLSPQRMNEGKEPIMSHGPSFFQWREPLLEYMIPIKAVM